MVLFSIRVIPRVACKAHSISNRSRVDITELGLDESNRGVTEAEGSVATSRASSCE
jgi:hypothetical protein